MKIPLKQWVMEQAERDGVTVSAITMRKSRGKYRKIKFLKLGTRAILWTMTESSQLTDDILMRAHRILKRMGPMRGSDLGWELWGNTTHTPKRGIGSHGHNKFCRPAGKVLRKLERLGKVVSQSRKTCTVWIAV